MMFLKTQALKLFKKVDTNLQHKSISIQLATPRTIATFYLGYQLYIRFIDHEVRKQMASESKSLGAYIDLFFKSQNHGFLIQNSLLYFGLISSTWAYIQSKNPFWLIGGSLYLGMLSYEYFFVEPLKQKLLKECMIDVGLVTQKKQMQKTQLKFDLIRKLTNLLNGKIVLSLITIIAFYIAELKHSQQVDMKMRLKE